MSIEVYSAEINDGISEVVKSQASIAYFSPINKFDKELELNEEMVRSFAADNKDLNYDKIDLYPLCSVLVTAGIWNRNDDIFDCLETWTARHSPEHKPVNIMHQQLDIIGHITSNYVVDSEYKAIAEDTAIDKLPSKFHIITTAVLYRYWENKDRQRLIAQLLDEIENASPAKHFVSMECMFRNFNYGVINAEGKTHIIERNEKTAGLTKHLRAYGGSGQFESYKIGRVLRQITFSGKGIVTMPANPESIIMTNVKTFASLGYIDLSQLNIHKESEMADYKDVEKLVADLKTDVTNTLNVRITALETQLSEKTKATDTAEKKVEEVEKEKAALTAAKEEDDKKMKDMEKDCKAMQAENEAYKKTMEAYKKASRQNAIKAHLGPDVNTEVLANGWAALDDAGFEAVLAAMPPWLKDKEKDKEDEKKDKGKADFGAHPIDGEKTTTPTTKTEDVNQFGKTSPKNPLTEDCSTASAETVISSAKVEDTTNLGVSFDNNVELSKVQADISNYFNKNRKKKGE